MTKRTNMLTETMISVRLNGPSSPGPLDPVVVVVVVVVGIIGVTTLTKTVPLALLPDVSKSTSV